jgi:hypothetical protein
MRYNWRVTLFSEDSMLAAVVQALGLEVRVPTLLRKLQRGGVK